MPRKQEPPKPEPESKEPVTFGDRPPDFDAKPPPEDSKPPEEPKPRRRSVPRTPPLKKRLEDGFLTIGLAVASTGDLHCAEIIMGQAKPLADAWGELAKVNPRVQAILERMLTGGAWSGVIFTTAATVIPIMAHHDLLPKSLPVPLSFGVPPSEEVRTHEPKPPTDEPAS